MSNNCLKAKSFILLLLMKSNRQKQRFCHPKMADLKAWSHGVRKANYHNSIKYGKNCLLLMFAFLAVLLTHIKLTFKLGVFRFREVAWF